MGARAVLGEPRDDHEHARRHRPKALDGPLRVDVPHQPHGVSALKQDEVMARHHAGEAAVGDDAQVMDPPPRHLEEGIEGPPGRVDGQERRRHHLSHRGGRREAVGNHLGAQVAIGHDADRSAIATHHRDRVDALARHAPRHLRDRGVRPAGERWALHEIGDPVHEERHLAAVVARRTAGEPSPVPGHDRLRDEQATALLGDQG